MKKISFKKICQTYRKSFIGFAFLLTCFLSLSLGCTLSMTDRTDYGSQIVNVIRNNNKSNGEGQTYWRCEPISSRKDWLGWGVKSYLTSLANPWATYGEQKNNNCFFYTDSGLNQTFIKNPSTNEIIPVSIFASPASRSLSCFDIRLENNLTPNTKYDFYCSKSVSNLLKSNLEAELIVDCGVKQVSSIRFNGVVESFGYKFIDDIANRNENYIIVPYVLKDDAGKEEIVSYDMQKYTGQTSFYAILKNDKYENNYYGLMINAIYQMGGVKDQLCYKGTYIDSTSNLFDKYEDIDSSVQKNYLEINKNGNYIGTVFGIILILLSIASLSFLLLKLKNGFYAFGTKIIFLASSISLIIYWIIGELFYNSNLTSIVFWDIGSRIFSFIFVTLVTIALIVLLLYLNKDKKVHEKQTSGVEYYSIDI